MNYKKMAKSQLTKRMGVILFVSLENTSMIDWVGYSFIRYPKTQPYLTDDKAVTLPKLKRYGEFSYTFFSAEALQEFIPEQPMPQKIKQL